MTRDTKKKKQRYTVVLLYPGWSTDDFGADIYVAWVLADSIEDAMLRAKRSASRDNDGGIEASAFRMIAMFPGYNKCVADATSDPY